MGPTGVSHGTASTSAFNIFQVCSTAAYVYLISAVEQDLNVTYLPGMFGLLPHHKDIQNAGTQYNMVYHCIGIKNAKTGANSTCVVVRGIYCFTARFNVTRKRGIR